MTRRRELPHPFGTTPFHVRSALDAGVSASRLRALDLDAPFHAVRSPATSTTVIERAVAYLPRMTEQQYFSGVTAAVIYGVPLPGPLTRSLDLDVSVTAPFHPPQAHGVRGHLAAEPRPLRLVRGMRVLAPAETWCELARTLAPDDLVIAGDYLVRRQHPASSLAQLGDAVDRLGARRHVRGLRLALSSVRQGTDSPRESRLRLTIIAGGLPEPVVHHEVHDADGFFVGTPDLAYVEQKIAIEYEGMHHQTDRATYESDISRRALFARAGWIVILVLNEHLRDAPQFVIRSIRDALAERAR